MKILFICFSTLKFDVKTPFEQPLGGTESAICYLSAALAKRGHEVSMMRNSDIDDTGTVINGVTHIKMTEEIVHLNPDVVIVASAPMVAPGVKKILPNAKVILWNHQQPDQPSMAQLFQDEFRGAIDDIVYVGLGQKNRFLEISPKVDGTVINNAIAPAFENLFADAEQIFSLKTCRGAYTSTPYRGLGVLAAIQEIPIDVYSSMAVYQGDDKAYEGMYAALRKNDCITLHGSVSQSELAERLKPITFMVYPSIFVECNSIAIMEAMAAGLKVITTDVAHAQDEFVDAMPFQKASVEEYTKLLRKNVNRFRSYPEEWAQQIWKQVQHVNENFTWAKRAQEWETHLKTLVAVPT